MDENNNSVARISTNEEKLRRAQLVMLLNCCYIDLAMTIVKEYENDPQRLLNDSLESITDIFRSIDKSMTELQVRDFAKNNFKRAESFLPAKKDSLGYLDPKRKLLELIEIHSIGFNYKHDATVYKQMLNSIDTRRLLSLRKDDYYVEYNTLSHQPFNSSIDDLYSRLEKMHQTLNPDAYYVPKKEESGEYRKNRYSVAKGRAIIDIFSYERLEELCTEEYAREKKLIDILQRNKIEIPENPGIGVLRDELTKKDSLAIIKIISAFLKESGYSKFPKGMTLSENDFCFAEKLRTILIHKTSGSFLQEQSVEAEETKRSTNIIANYGLCGVFRRDDSAEFFGKDGIYYDLGDVIEKYLYPNGRMGVSRKDVKQDSSSDAADSSVPALNCGREPRKWLKLTLGRAVLLAIAILLGYCGGSYVYDTYVVRPRQVVLLQKGLDRLPGRLRDNLAVFNADGDEEKLLVSLYLLEADARDDYPDILFKAHQLTAETFFGALEDGENHIDLSTDRAGRLLELSTDLIELMKNASTPNSEAHKTTIGALQTRLGLAKQQLDARIQQEQDFEKRLKQLPDELRINLVSFKTDNSNAEELLTPLQSLVEDAKNDYPGIAFNACKSAAETLFDALEDGENHIDLSTDEQERLLEISNELLESMKNTGTQYSFMENEPTIETLQIRLNQANQRLMERRRLEEAERMRQESKTGFLKRLELLSEELKFRRDDFTHQKYVPNLIAPAIELANQTRDEFPDIALAALKQAADVCLGLMEETDSLGGETWTRLNRHVGLRIDEMQKIMADTDAAIDLEALLKWRTEQERWEKTQQERCIWENRDLEEEEVWSDFTQRFFSPFGGNYEANINEFFTMLRGRIDSAVEGKNVIKATRLLDKSIYLSELLARANEELNYPYLYFYAALARDHSRSLRALYKEPFSARLCIMSNVVNQRIDEALKELGVVPDN